MRSNKTTNAYLLCFFLTLFLMPGAAAYGAEQAPGGSSGSQPGILPVSGDKDLPAISSDAQALMRGGKGAIDFEEVLIDTGQPGLGGGSGSQPWVFPVSGEEELTDSAEAQALRDGYEVIAYTEEVLGDTGQSGLGGETGSQPRFIPVVEDKGVTASTSRGQKK